MSYKSTTRLYTHMTLHTHNSSSIMKSFSIKTPRKGRSCHNGKNKSHAKLWDMPPGGRSWKERKKNGKKRSNFRFGFNSFMMSSNVVGLKGLKSTKEKEHAKVVHPRMGLPATHKFTVTL